MRLSRRPRELWRRYAAATGLREVRDLDQRVTSLEESVAENTVLEAALEERVAELEKSVLRVARARAGGRRS